MDEFIFILLISLLLSGFIYLSNEAKKEINYRIIKLKEKYIRILEDLNDISKEEYDIIKLKILEI
jgi:hypothetical protein